MIQGDTCLPQISPNSVSQNVMEKVILSITKISNQPSIDGMSTLKDKLLPKWKLSHYLLNPMQTESWMKSQVLQTISGASEQHSVAPFSF